MPEKRLNPDDLAAIARLARLSLSPGQLETIAPQLESILGYVAQIALADVTGIEPMAHATKIVNVLRQDVVEPSLTVEQVLQNAPESDGRFFKVPKVIGGDEDSAG